MLKLKFLSLLKKLSRQELKDFHKHLKQQHPREKIALMVFEYMVKFYPAFEPPEKLKMAYAYQKIFKKDFENDRNAQKKMLNTASDLYNWMKDFLIISKALQNPQLQQSIWLSILQERAMDEELSRKATAFYQQTRNTPFEKTADAMPNWIAGYFYRESLARDNPIINVNSIQECTETMTSCSEVLRLKMACEIRQVKKVSDQSPTKKLKQAVDYQQVGLSTVKDIFEALWQLTDTGEELYFIRLESLLIQHGQRIDLGELDVIIRYAYNFIADQSRINQEAIHYERMHRLNKIIVAYGVFLKEGHLPSSAFCNIVTVACHAKDLEWASSFIQNNSLVLLEKHRQKAILLAQAIVAFETRNFEHVLSLLEQVEFEAPLDILRAKSLLLRSYYELNSDLYLILETCTSLENFLRRSPKTDTIKAMLAFVLILRRLATQKSSKNVIIERIEQAPLLYCKNWLLEKTVYYKARYADRNITKKRHTQPYK